MRWFKHPGGHWDPPPPQYRRLRVDPPEGQREHFAVLSTADNLACVAAECRILQADVHDRWTWRTEATGEYRVVRYRLDRPALFIPIDHPNAKVLGLAGTHKAFNSYAS